MHDQENVQKTKEAQEAYKREQEKKEQGGGEGEPAAAACAHVKRAREGAGVLD